MKKFLSIICMLFLVAAFTSAQELGSIKGKVVDADGAALPGVSISLTGVKIASMSAVTSAEGNFRFMYLPVAKDYVVKFEMAGFKTLTREKIVVSYGRDVILDITMEQAALEEEVTVVGETPVIDRKRTQVGVNVTEEMIMSLPTARNPWVIMALIPGMLVDREDIGGNEAGQQSAYYGHGSSGDDNTWNIDGANITDNSALGAAPAYVNIASYEELQINYGNNDVRAQTGGVQLNIISKRGGNAYSGTFYLDVEDKAWQADNVPSELKDRGYTLAGVNKVYLYGANFGGPLIRDRAWFYGSWAVQDIDKLTLAATSDKTWLVSAYAKLDFQITPNTRANAFLEYDNKNKWGRTAWGATLQGAETLWNQTGPGYMYKGEIEQMFGNLYLDVKAIYMDGGFNLLPVQGKRTAGGTGKYMLRTYYPSFYVSGNIDDYGTDRNQLNVNATGNYFAEGVLGGDHEIKFGVDYVTATTTTFDLYEGNLTIADWGGGWIEAWLLRDYLINYWFQRYSAFIQDTMTFGNLAINIGVRYDNEASKVKNADVPASPWLPQYMPALKIDELDPGVQWKNFSPRISLSYDLFGNGKDVIKVSVARYGSQSGNDLASFVNPMGWTEIDVLWVDANSDGRVTSNELWGWDGGLADVNDPNNWLWWGYFDPAKPTLLESPNKYDPNYNSPLLDELSASYEKELLPDFAARLELFYKKRHNLTYGWGIFSDGTQETRDNWYQKGIEPNTGLPYYSRYKRPIGTYRTNSENQYQRYMAAQIVLKKRLSNNWMLDSSFTYSDWTFHYGDDYINPNNVGYYDGGVVAPGSGGSGLTGIYVNSRWQLKISGLYQFPFGINASGVFVAREGYVIPTYSTKYIPNVGTTNIYGHAGSAGTFGDTRLPSFWVLNFRIEKVFHVTETSSVVLSADAFNISNGATSLKQAGRFDATDYLQTKIILSPRLFRFGVRFTF